MREWIKALPLGLGLPILIGAASVKPEDAASNIAAWLHVAGFEHIPAWLSSPGIDNRVIEGSFAIGAIYAFIIWGIPALRRRQAFPQIASPSDDKVHSPTVTQYLPSTAPSILLTDGWILNFNPEILTGRKPISFNPDGKIGEGRHRNECTWSMVGDELEIRRQNGDLQNRFRFDPHGNKFISTNHPDAKGIRDQFIFRDRAAQNSN